jgi:hypothetical protein
MPARRKRDTINRAAQRQLEAIGYATGPDPPDTGTGDDRVKRAPSQDPVDVYVRKRRAARAKKKK